MTGQLETVLCRYQYDPIDRLASCAPLSQQSSQRFYRNDRLGTEIQGPTQYSFFEHGSQVLAQQRREAGRVECALQGADLPGTVLHTVAVGEHQQPVYSPYGYCSPESGLISLKGFNGERRDPVTGLYLLGNGHRPFSSILMRFICPDRLSPFGKGGLNAFAYCADDPVNRVDPTGKYFAAALVSGITAAQQAHRIVRSAEAVVSAPIVLAKRIGNGAQALGRRVNKMVGPTQLTQLQEATETLKNATSNLRSVDGNLRTANSLLIENMKQLDSIKQNPGIKAPLGSAEYEKLVSKPTMAAFQAHRQVEALKAQLKNAEIDAFNAFRRFEEARVLENIRKGT